MNKLAKLRRYASWVVSFRSSLTVGHHVHLNVGHYVHLNVGLHVHLHVGHNVTSTFCEGSEMMTEIQNKQTLSNTYKVYAPPR